MDNLVYLTDEEKRHLELFRASDEEHRRFTDLLLKIIAANVWTEEEASFFLNYLRTHIK